MSTFSSDDYKGLESNSQRLKRESELYNEWKKQYDYIPEKPFKFTDFDNVDDTSNEDIDIE